MEICRVIKEMRDLLGDKVNGVVYGVKIPLLLEQVNSKL